MNPDQETIIEFEDDYDELEITVRHVTRKQDGATSSWFEAEATNKDTGELRMVDFRLTKTVRKALLDALNALPDDVEPTVYGPAVGQA